MICHPRPGQRVIVHYAKGRAELIGRNDQSGVVTAVGKGPGPINAAVLVDGQIVVVPRGNLVAGRVAV